MFGCKLHKGIKCQTVFEFPPNPNFVRMSISFKIGGCPHSHSMEKVAFIKYKLIILLIPPYPLIYASLITRALPVCNEALLFFGLVL